ncbi:T9SS type A sorting domain-containing protein [Taibaiella soli]|uniref:Secretion system C-terminal sorting domain-containing protein n=1 Tax=Taibaiella soli TaxID=1649169 RepID=A0A2W2AZC5_9BACT|nr:T9SS type A sorting domain-containing protein [Taibaiella soli]PZF73374.1 hypothetical protein DN068_08260 [Taibaiella soli]
MKENILKHTIAIFFLLVTLSGSATAQTDTLHVMAYNVLNYGEYPLCQGDNGTYHNYLKTIVQFTNPDILSLEKMGSIKLSASDFHGTAPLGFGDSIVQYALNAAYPGKYAYCMPTNNSQADNMSVLFYNRQKLGFVAIVSSYANITDFNTYKLFYKDPNLAATHDTTFLYVTINHDQSGSSSTSRDQQIAGEMQQLQTHFSHLPNMINMGDFNTRSSAEPCYQTLTATPDTGFRFYDPPFTLDNHLTYPANWDALPQNYSAYLTTSTRQSASVPNTCGTSGGGKSWYDHIFLSPWIAHNTNYISYLPNSYRTIGNDGHRLSVSINDNSTTANNAAPADVIEALFQMSNKYPVMVDLLVTQNTTGNSPADPEMAATAVPGMLLKNAIAVVNPVGGDILLHCATSLMNKKIEIGCYNTDGKVVLQKDFVVDNPVVAIPCMFNPGIYFIRVVTTGQTLIQQTIIKS